MHPWLAARTELVDSSGIRKVFDLAAKMTDPINLSIGQPDFPVPDAIKQAAIDAIRADRNGYSQTQGIGELRERLQARLDAEYRQADRREQSALLAEALGRLDEDDREVLVLRHLEGLTFPEVARRLGRTEDSVKKRWPRALVRLRQAFRGGEP